MHICLCRCPRPEPWGKVSWPVACRYVALLQRLTDSFPDHRMLPRAHILPAYSPLEEMPFRQLAVWRLPGSPEAMKRRSLVAVQRNAYSYLVSPSTGLWFLFYYRVFA